jgi:hypothetical protein
MCWDPHMWARLQFVGHGDWGEADPRNYVSKRHKHTHNYTRYDSREHVINLSSMNVNVSVIIL